MNEKTMPESTTEEIQEAESSSKQTEDIASQPLETPPPIEQMGESEQKEEETAPPQPAVAVEEEEEPVDWDELESQSKGFRGSEDTETAAKYIEFFSSPQERDVVEGTVTAITAREVFVRIGYKSEGMISRNELRYNPDLQVGDPLEVYIEQVEDSRGQLVLSHKKARMVKAWDRVNMAYENGEIINGYIKCRTKGGMIVDIFGIETFLPGSQIDVKPVRDYDAYVGQIREFKIVKINREFKNVVVSHKALIEAELEEQRRKIMSKLEVGQVLEGTVKNLTSYGAFVDLGGIDGLVHVTDISWERINNPSERLELDQKVNVVILEFDEERKRIALGIKQLSPHPWDSLDKAIEDGSKVKGKVVALADYGAFVEIISGVEGLLHVSEMSWSQHLRSAQEILSVGDEIECVVLSISREEHKMSLGIKQLSPDPWVEVSSKYPEGSRHHARVRNYTNFGVFVELEDGVDGLIHISDLSWIKKIRHPSEMFKVGDELDVIVLSADAENRRLSLGYKQLEENPWDMFEDIFAEGTIYEGTVMEVIEKGAIISLPHGVEAFTTPKHLIKEDGTRAVVDEKLEFKVLECNKDSKRIIVSHSRVFEDKQRRSKTGEKKSDRRSIRDVNSATEKTTLGDMDELSELKDQLKDNDTE